MKGGATHGAATNRSNASAYTRGLTLLTPQLVKLRKAYSVRELTSVPPTLAEAWPGPRWKVWKVGADGGLQGRGGSMKENKAKKGEKGKKVKQEKKAKKRPSSFSWQA